LFYNGKVTLTGATSTSGVRFAAENFCEFLCSLGHTDVALNNLKINQYVGSCSYEKNISLTQFYERFKSESVYEVELFPGLIFKPKAIHATYILFYSGKINITGCATAEKLSLADSFIRQALSLI